MGKAATTPKAVTLDSLDEAQVASLLAQLEARKQAEKDAEKAHRDAQKTLGEEFVAKLAQTPPQTFSSGAQGWMVPVKITVPGYGEVKGQIGPLRITSTIPAE